MSIGMLVVVTLGGPGGGEGGRGGGGGVCVWGRVCEWEDGLGLG